jgi:site-specific recombinase XerD
MSLDALRLGVGNTLFISERRRPLERSNVCKMVNTFAKAAGLAQLNVHPHMLRHSCGYDLANRGVDTRYIQGYLGHRNIQHTVRSTELSPTRFANLAAEKIGRPDLRPHLLRHRRLTRLCSSTLGTNPLLVLSFAGQSSLSSLQYYYRVSLEEKSRLLTVK